MNLFSRLPVQLQQAFHGRAASEIHDHELRQWLDSQRGVPRPEAKAAARTLNEVYLRRDARVDLRHLKPETIDALPECLIRRMAPYADHLLLPDGCHPDLVMRLIEPLCLSTLSAYGMKGRDAPWRDDGLPERLTMIRSDKLPVPTSDLIGTHRLYEIQNAAAAAYLDAHPRRIARPSTPAGGAAPGATNTLDDYVRAASIASDLVHWSASRPPGESFTFMSEASTAAWRNLLDRVDTGLLAPKAARACEVVRAWLAGRATASLSPIGVSQLALVATALARTFTMDTPGGAALASSSRLAQLQKLRLWIEDAPDLHVRTDREIRVSKDIGLRAPELAPRPTRLTAARGALGSTDSGFGSAGSLNSWSSMPAEVDYVSTPVSPPVYEDEVPSSPASAVDDTKTNERIPRAGREILPPKEDGRRAPELLAPRPTRLTAARGALGSTDSGFASEGSSNSGSSMPAEADYVNTRVSSPVYEAPSSPASAVDDAKTNERIPRAGHDPRLKGRPLSPLPPADIVDAAEAALRPVRRMLALHASRGGSDVPINGTQRARLFEALARTGDVLPPRLAGTRERALHSLGGEAPWSSRLSGAQARDLIALIDALRDVSSQARADDERPALPRRPRHPRG